jgi:hypothetical protein
LIDRVAAAPLCPQDVGGRRLPPTPRRSHRRPASTWRPSATEDESACFDDLAANTHAIGELMLEGALPYLKQGFR